MSCCDPVIHPQLPPSDPIVQPSGMATENVSQLGYIIGSGEPVLVEVIRAEGGAVIKYVGHRGNGLSAIDPILSSQFTWTAPSVSASKPDAEVVCLSNNGGTTKVKGVVVYDLSVMPPTESYYVAGALVTGYSIVDCDTPTADLEKVTTCLQAIGNPNQKYERIDWFNTSVSTNVPVSTIYFNKVSLTYVSAPSNVEACFDATLSRVKTHTFTAHLVVSGSQLDNDLSTLGNLYFRDGVDSNSILANSANGGGELVSVSVKAYDCSRNPLGANTVQFLDGGTGTGFLDDGEVVSFSLLEREYEAFINYFNLKVLGTGNALITATIRDN